jgi:site-specific recombinase XerD
LVNKTSVSTLAELTNFTKAYISQVKTGKKAISPILFEMLVALLPQKKESDYLFIFLQSRRAMGVSRSTLDFYRYMLNGFVVQTNYLKASKHTIERYLNSIPANHNGLATRHASYRALKTFYRWLNTEYGFNNPMKGMPAPILGKPIMPTLDESQVKSLIDAVDNTRDKAIIALFVESGLRLSELANIKLGDINWADHCIQTLGKGRKAAYAPVGSLSADYLKQWIYQYQPKDNIWNLNAHGIATMLRRLEDRTGITCNPHTFRRTFAVLLRKAGIDTMTIKELGRWESLEMVQRYTRSFSFQDSMKFYKSPLAVINHEL